MCLRRLKMSSYVLTASWCIKENQRRQPFSEWNVILKLWRLLGERSLRPAVIKRCKCPFAFFRPDNLCICVNAIRLRSCWFCIVDVGSTFHVLFMFCLLLLSNPGSSCCHCLLTAQFQARSVPGKLLWVNVVRRHIFCYSRPLVTLLVCPCWTSICSHQGCESPRSLGNTEPDSVQAWLQIHQGVSKYSLSSVLFSLEAEKDPMPGPGLLFTSISDSWPLSAEEISALY